MTPLIVAFIWLLASTTAASAHDHGPGSWINRQQLKDPLSKHHCCSAGRDCIEVPHGGLTETGGGYRITESGEHWPYARVIWESQDGRWWRCVYMSDSVLWRRFQTRCLIGPMPSF